MRVLLLTGNTIKPFVIRSTSTWSKAHQTSTDDGDITREVEADTCSVFFCTLTPLPLSHDTYSFQLLGNSWCTMLMVKAVVCPRRPCQSQTNSIRRKLILATTAIFNPLIALASSIQQNSRGCCDRKWLRPHQEPTEKISSRILYLHDHPHSVADPSFSLGVLALAIHDRAYTCPVANRTMRSLLSASISDVSRALFRDPHWTQSLKTSVAV